MAFYKGVSSVGSILDKMIELLTKTPQGATSPYWQKVGSGTVDNEGIILHSKGKSGKDLMYLRFKPSTTNRFFEVTLLESYAPNPIQGLAGVMTNESGIGYVGWMGSGTGKITDPVSYILSFDRDKMIISTLGDRSVTSSIRSVFSAGTIERTYSPIEEPVINSTYISSSLTANGIAPSFVSGTAAYEACALMMRSRALKLHQYYSMIIMSCPNVAYVNLRKGKGWNNTIIASDIYLQGFNALGPVEGIRGKMGGVKTLPAASSDFIDGEEMMIGSKRYTIVNSPSFSAKSSWPGAWLAIEQIL